MLCLAWPTLGKANQLVAAPAQKVTASTIDTSAKLGNESTTQRRAARQFIAVASENFPPVNFLSSSGQLSGFGIELSTAVIEAVGGHVSHLHSSIWGEVMANLESGRADFIHDTGYTPERAIAFDFSDPILEMSESIFVAADRYNISGLDTLKARKVACVKGHISHLYLQQFPEIECLIVATPIEGLQALVDGRVDAFVYPQQIALFLAQKNGWTGQIKITGEPLRRLTWHMTVRKGDVEMLALLNKGIAIVKASGAYDRIYEKWFGRVFLEGYSKRELEIAALAAAVLSSALAGMVFLALYVHRLRRTRADLRLHISERDAAQETLSHFFDLSQNMLCVAGFDGYFKRINKAWSHVLGFSEAELLRAPFINFVHPDDREATLRESAKLAQGGVTISFENRYLTSTGEYRWLLWSAIGFSETEQIYATASDITARKHDEEALRLSRDLLEQRVAERTWALAESEARFKAIADYTYGWEIWIGEDGTLRWVNPAVESVTGYSIGETMTMQDYPLCLVIAEDRTRVASEIVAARGGGSSNELEFNVRAKDGRTVPVSASYQAIRDAQGKLDGSRWSIRDISERRESQRRISDINARLETLVSSSPAVIFCCSPDSDFRVTYISPNVERQMGLRPEQFTGKASFWAENVHPDDAPIVFKHLEALSDRPKHSHEYRFKFGDGTYHWMHGELSLRRDEHGTPLEIVGAWLDITPLKQAEQAAAAANEAKSNFLASMSHELRTPLNAILGFGQLLELEAKTQVQTDYVEEILRAGQHLLELINEVLDLAKVESGRLSFSLEPTPLSPLLDECLTLMKPQARARDIRMTKLAIDGNVQVLADHTRLKQVLLNLLSNAIKYNHQGGKVDVSCSLGNEDGTTLVCIGISDSGAGLSPEQLSKLFIPFERLGVDSSIEGTGIGLALTKRLIELMGGIVGVDSTPGVGSNFWVKLPLAEAAATSREIAGSTTGIETHAATGEQRREVLCIEDTPANLRLIEGIFARRPDVRLLTAVAPGLGLELARSHRPALILLDINLPDMDGYEVMQSLRENEATRSIPVVAISANAMPKDLERGRAAGFVDYVTKPFDLVHLLRVVDRHLER
jgi:hypothetical protein